MAKELTEQRYQQLKRAAEEAREEAQRAKGAREELLKMLKKEFDCDSVEAAEEKLAKLEKETEDAKKEFEKALNDYERKWK